MIDIDAKEFSLLLERDMDVYFDKNGELLSINKCHINNLEKEHLCKVIKTVIKHNIFLANEPSPDEKALKRLVFGYRKVAEFFILTSIILLISLVFSLTN